MDNTKTIVAYRIEERQKGTEKWNPLYGETYLSEMEVQVRFPSAQLFSHYEYRMVKVTTVLHYVSTEIEEITQWTG